MQFEYVSESNITVGREDVRNSIYSHVLHCFNVNEAVRSFP